MILFRIIMYIFYIYNVYYAFLRECTLFLVSLLNSSAIKFSLHPTISYLITQYMICISTIEYGTEKAKVWYISENDDPSKSKSHFTTLAQKELVNVE